MHNIIAQGMPRARRAGGASPARNGHRGRVGGVSAASGGSGGWHGATYQDTQALLTYVKNTILFPIKRAQTSIKSVNMFTKHSGRCQCPKKSTQTRVGSFTTQSHYPVTPTFWI